MCFFARKCHESVQYIKQDVIDNNGIKNIKMTVILIGVLRGGGQGGLAPPPPLKLVKV